MKKFLLLALLLVLATLHCDQDDSSKKPEFNLNYTDMETRVADKIQRLHQEVQRNPDNASAWGKFGMTLDVHGLNQEAIESYQKAAELDPQNFRWAYYCAIAMKENASADAIKWFDTAIRLNPNYAPLQIRYGNALFEAGRFAEAESPFRRTTEIDPNNAAAFVGLAQIASSKNDVNAAKNFAEKAIAANPRQREAYSLLSTLYRRLEQRSKAEEAQTKLKSLPEKSPFVDPVYSALVAEGESAFWYRTRGRTYLDSGMYLLAVREFKTALQLREDAESYDNLGAALQKLEKWDEAVLYHKKAASLNPKSYLSFYNLGIAYGKLDRLPHAILAFQKSIELNGEYSEAYYNLGVAFFKLSQWESARKNLERAIELNPQHANAHFALAMVHLESGNTRLAHKEVQVLQKLDPQLAAKFPI